MVKRKIIQNMIMFLFTGSILLAQTVTYDWEIKKDSDGKENIPIVFRIAQTDPSDSRNNVHQIELVFNSQEAQVTGGSGAEELYFEVYVPGSLGPEIITISNPPILDADPDYTMDHGGNDGYYLTLEKIDVVTEWKLEIKYKPYTGPTNGFGVIGSFPHLFTEEEFVVIAKNVRLPDPATGKFLSTVSMELGTRTRAEYNSAAVLGNTGLTFDPPPEITISEPVIPSSNLLAYSVTTDAVAPYVTETFTVTVTNDVPAELTGNQWQYDPPGPGILQTVNADTANFEFNTLDFHEVVYSVEEAIFGTVTQKSSIYLPVVVKFPPVASVTLTSIGGTPPTTTPAVDDIPTQVSFSANGFVHNDPLILIEPEPFDDGNTTDYEIVRWEIYREGYAIPIEVLASSLTDPEVLLNQTIFENGKHTVNVVIEDDYGIEGSGSVDFYAAPIEKMVFPPHRGVPFDDNEPDIDGVLEYFDVDGDGIRDPVDDPDTDDDIFEHGWTGSYRLTYENGAYPPNIAFQGTRNRSTSQPYLYLSFEVRNDPTFDNEDVIVLTFRRDADSIDPVDDRKIFIFPVYTEAGASNDNGSGGPADPNPLAEKYNKPPRLIQYWKRNVAGDWESAASITSSPDGFDIKVLSKTDGSSRIYDVEIQVPTNTIAGGTDWIDFDDDFLFHFNVIRVDTTTPGDPKAVEYTWPRDLPIDYLAQDNLEDYSFPALVWGKSFKTATDECRGVTLEAWNDIGIDDGSDDLSHLMSLSTENRFVARVTNNSEKVIEDPMAPGEHIVAPVPADDVRATFRIAHWGVVGQDGDWREIPTGDNPTSFQDIPAGAGDTEPKYEFETLWTLSPTEADYYDDNLHQCIKVELDSIADTNILKKGVARNMDFDATSSLFSRTARISTVGFGQPPAGKDMHSVILQVATKEWERNADPSGGAKKSNQTTGVESYFNYIVNGYIDTGRVIVINKKSCKIYAPMGSFGYVVFHDSEVSRWIHDIEGAEEVAKNTYQMEIGSNSFMDIVTRIQSKEPHGLSLSLHAGAASPVVPSAFADDYSTGFCVFGDLGYKLSNQWFIVSLFGYNYFPAKNTGIDNTSIINIALNLKRFFPVPNRPKFTLGIGAGLEMFIHNFDTVDWGYDVDLSLGYKINKTLTLEGGFVYHSNIDQENWFMQSHGGIVIKF